MDTKHGLIFRAIPDTGKVRIVPDPIRGVKPVFPNCTVIPSDTLSEVKKFASVYHFPSRTTLPVADIRWIVNVCADADEYRNALMALAEEFEGKNVPIFNHPKAILATRRDINAERLTGIPNLVVPKCVRFLADSPEVFVNTFRDNEFEYPVLVRPARSQTGTGLMKISDPNEWDKVHTIPWPGENMYMTQYVDFSGEDGVYRKFRMAYANKQFHFRSFNESASWLIHGGKRTSEMVERELEMQEVLSKNAEFTKMLAHISQIVGLDFWGIDLGITSQGEFLFFEANAAMSITTNIYTPPELLKMMDPIKIPIAKNVHISLLSPSTWRTDYAK